MSRGLPTTIPIAPEKYPAQKSADMMLPLETGCEKTVVLHHRYHATTSEHQSQSSDGGAQKGKKASAETIQINYAKADLSRDCALPERAQNASCESIGTR